MFRLSSCFFPLLARVRRYRDAGVEFPLLRPATPEHATKLQDLFAVR